MVPPCFEAALRAATQRLAWARCCCLASAGSSVSEASNDAGSAATAVGVAKTLRDTAPCQTALAPKMDLFEAELAPRMDLSAVGVVSIVATLPLELAAEIGRCVKTDVFLSHVATDVFVLSLSWRFITFQRETHNQAPYAERTAGQSCRLPLPCCARECAGLLQRSKNGQRSNTTPRDVGRRRQLRDECSALRQIHPIS
eukprot:COSAG06_NODE_7670_length_2419_cov_2.534914_3_plen_199_part_00